MKRAAKRKAKSPAPDTKTTLASAIVQAPRLAAPKTARAKLAGWLGEIASTSAGRALARLVKAEPKVEALLAGLAEGSPFLWELAVAEPARLVGLLDSLAVKREGHCAMGHQEPCSVHSSLSVFRSDELATALLPVVGNLQHKGGTQGPHRR